jgi:predicted nuclease of predicted toxin-antitoxin system
MRLLGWPLLADENIGRQVVAALQNAGCNVAHCRDNPGADDRAVLDRAELEGRIVLTHDSDLATLVLRERRNALGVVYIRPAHLDPVFIMETIQAIERTVGDIEAGFIVVGDRRGEKLRVRLRRW